MQLYKVKLVTGHTARPDQICGEYLGYEGFLAIYTRGEAIKKANLFRGKIEKHGKNYTANNCKVMRLSKDELSKAVLLELNGREVYIDKDNETFEPIYYGDVFSTILGEHPEQTMLSFNQDVIDELTILDNICASYEYVMIL